MKKILESELNAAGAVMVDVELNGMPPMDECGKCAKDLFDVLAKIEQCAIDKRNAMLALTQALKASKRVSIKYKEKTFVLEHMEESDVIKIKK